MDGVPVLSGVPLEDLTELLHPLPAYRARQIFKWISRGSSSFDTMSDLPLQLREELGRRFRPCSSSPASRVEDDDGTKKLQIALSDGERIEAVLLSDGSGRRTACLSSQAGCPMACVFCRTGSLGFGRNLSSGEIYEQFLHLKADGEDISNIVIMGMGEPLLNLPELRKALSIITDPAGTGLSKRRITLSTCGIVEGILDISDHGPDVRLALSLTSADPLLRAQLMPVEKTNPLPRLKEALLYYQKRQGRRITLEAVLLGGINTREKDAASMAEFARGLDVIVNLIPWNPAEGLCFGGAPLREPALNEFESFSRSLEKKGLKVTRRRRKGRTVSGACGQLGIIRKTGGAYEDEED